MVKVMMMGKREKRANPAPFQCQERGRGEGDILRCYCLRKLARPRSVLHNQTPGGVVSIAHAHTDIHTYKKAHTQRNTKKYTHKLTEILIYIYIYIYICIYIYTHTNTH
ncbi:unnamed protein product [Lota lota]